MILSHLPAAVVFDMDGLLFDTEILYAESIQDAARSLGREFPMALFQRMLGNPWPANRDLVVAEWGNSAEVDALRDAWNERFEALVETRLALKPGAADLLGTLDDLELPRAIATSGTHDEVRRNLAACALEGRFGAVVARGDYTRGKPEPDPYLLAAARLGIEPRECLALEDSHTGVRSAAAAGMMTVMVPDLLAPTESIRALCSGVVASLHDVRRVLLEVARTGR